MDSNITNRNNVRELNLDLRLDKPFSIPSSLFTCESLTKLELCASRAIRIPKSLSFPKLKSLILIGIQFTEDDGWNEKHFSNFPVLENLILKECTWHGMNKFCILTPVLKVLEFLNSDLKKDGLQDCDLKIHAPNLVSLSQVGGVAKDYDLSSFVKLDRAEICFYKYDGEERIGLGAAVSKFFLALSHVRSLEISTFVLETVLAADDFVNVLPTFLNMNNLDLILGPASDELIFAFIKAAPNLKRLQCGDEVLWSDDAGRVFDETQELFRHLQSVGFEGFVGNPRELRWVKFILKNAKSLETVNILDMEITIPKTKM
ncbi:putative FBD-associated F-box protein At5g56700 [Papaver somniferum]|uniref:putative FBD-associated F-box protein At5g56700 n=1 Tax=Papaver somniferum TaxID=3469 RepID=UPI000E6FB326|nr:putative FBD-associated F-box protein At5g56700 [Papaver somniferum]